jgi:hypothetical protein
VADSCEYDSELSGSMTISFSKSPLPHGVKNLRVNGKQKNCTLN